MKALLWMLLTVTAIAQPSDEVRVDLTGMLIAPPCIMRFPTSQQVKLGEANINQLQTDSAAATDVPLIFDCQADSHINLTLTAGSGSSDTQTLLTTRPDLGLRLRLLLKGEMVDFNLGQTSSFPVDDGLLELTLRVQPVFLGQLPTAGSYNTILLLQITYR